MKKRYPAARVACALFICTAAGTAAIAQTRSADAYPTRPIRVIVPYTPGGSSDAVARILSAKLPEILGQQLVIDNRPGAAGSLGRELVAKAAPDGYTLLVGDSPHTINVHVLRHVPYDPIRDFTPISLIATAPQLMVIHPAVPARNVKEFIALAGSTRQAQLRIRRQRLDHASHRRAFQARGESRHRSRALQEHCERTD